MVTTMATDKTGRAVIEEVLTPKVKELGDLLGHTSISQTINFLISLHIDDELKAARAYRERKQK